MALHLDSLLAVSFLRRWWLVLSLGLLLEFSSNGDGDGDGDGYTDRARVVQGPVMR